MTFSIDGGFLSHGDIETTMVTTEDPPWLTFICSEKHIHLRYGLSRYNP